MKRLPVLGLLLALALLVAACSTGGSTTTSSTTVRAAPAASVAGTTLVAAGDIACPPGQAPSGQTCRQAATAAMARRLSPKVVLPLGDEQYQVGSLDAFDQSYDKSWGTLRPISRPVPGNHEYKTAGARGYFSYFAGRTTARGYYRVPVGGWNLYLLNSNCYKISCATEARWLDAEMTAHPSRCSLVAMHHPRYSSGAEHGDNTSVRGLWNVALRHRAEVSLAGHDHDYERFAPMDADGRVLTTGMQSFVVGTGGKNMYPRGPTTTGSRFFQNRVAGVLRLSLGSSSYSWSYHDIYGQVLDSGSLGCR